MPNGMMESCVIPFAEFTIVFIRLTALITRTALALDLYLC